MMAAMASAGATSEAIEQTKSEDAFIAWSGSRAIGLRSVESFTNDSDLQPFCDFSAHASVLALGEPGHGAHEPLELRNRIFTYLVKHCGFTAIAIETAFTESRTVHDYVEGGVGDAAQITRRSLSWGFGDYAENAELIQWLHDYNQHRGSDRKLQFYGIDLSGADNNSAFTHPELALNAVVEYVRTTAPGRSREVLKSLEPALKRISAIGYANLARMHDVVLDSTIRSLREFLKLNAASLIQSSTKSKYDWAEQGLVVAFELNEMLGLDVEPERPSAPMPPDTYKVVNVRDAAMARNVMWVRSEEGKDGRILVFAHNAHVMNAPSQGGVWAVFAKPPRMMGQHLRSSLGDSIVIIGMSAARNGEGLPAAPPLQNCVETTLKKIGLPLFVLKLRDDKKKPQGPAWLDERHLLRANFNSNLDVELGAAFDALVFMDLVTAARKNASAGTTIK